MAVNAIYICNFLIFKTYFWKTGVTHRWLASHINIIILYYLNPWVVHSAWQLDGDESSAQIGPVRNIKPLCPTRWLVRMPAINATLQQYKLILQTLEEAQLTCSSDVSARAAGLQRRFQDPNTVMCLILAQHVIEPLECLNRALYTFSENDGSWYVGVSENCEVPNAKFSTRQ